MKREKTALGILRDHLWSWIEDENGFDYRDPLPGNPFTLVEERGPARIAEWIISRRFYFWSLDVPKSLFSDGISSQQKVELIDCLREQMRCYSYKTNLQLKNQSQEYIRGHFRREWMFPSSSGGSQGHGKDNERDVRKGLDAFRQEHEAFLNLVEFERFSKTVNDEIALYRRMSGYDDDAAYKAYYKLLCAFIAYGAGRGIPDTLELSTIAFWEDPERVCALVEDMGSWFSGDVLMGQHAKRFEEATREELKMYLSSLDEFDSCAGTDTADFQSALMTVCTVRQLFDVASGKSPDRVGIDEFQVHEIGELLGWDRIEQFKLWGMTAKGEWLPEFVMHKANVVWNVMVGSTVSPAQVLPNVQGKKTVVASIVVQGSRLESAIVAGCPPVDIFNISEGVNKRGSVASFDLGSEESPRENGMLFVIGRSNGMVDTDDAKVVKKRLQDCLGELLDRWMGDGSKLITLMKESVKSCPVWFKCGASYRMFDLSATDALTETLLKAIGAFETWSHPVGERVFSGKAMKDLLNSAVDGFFDAERLYLKSELPDVAKTAHGESERRFTEIPVGSREEVVFKTLYGKAAVKESAVRGCVETYILGFYNRLIEEWSKCVKESCEERGIPISFVEVLIDEVKLQIAPSGHAVPQTVDEDRLIIAVDSIMDAARERYKKLFLSVGGEGDPDLSVSREQLVMRADEGRAVLESVTKNSPSFVRRRGEGGKVTYLVMGADDQRAKMIELLRDAGVEAGDGVVVKQLEEGAFVGLMRGDVVHLGGRTELELH